ncbi:methionyl-tRNA formyltransferase, partial [Candidatus Jorgensenbacteria bacterium CG_4_9_14_3_um_filter_38_10]
MKYLFFGTPEFAAIILEKLINAGFIPSAVVCNPDKPTGRKKIITPPLTKLLAIKYNIPVLQPEVLSIFNFQFSISNFDFFIVASYAKILPKEILEIPRFGTIGVHPSLLPKYRGPSPIQAAILNEEQETGVTLFLLDEKVDHGPVLENRKQKIENSDNYKTLHNKLAELGGDLLIETIPKFLREEIKSQPQDESQATYTKKFSAEDGFVGFKDLEKAQKDGGQIAIEVERKIRALNPEPGVWTIKDGKRMKILEAELMPDKTLKLKKIQFEGKK